MRRNDPSWQAGLSSLLRDQGAIAAALQDALQKEHLLLMRGGDEDVAPLAAEKDALLHRLEVVETLRRRWLADAGADPGDPAGWVPPGATDKHEIGPLWQGLRRQIAECRRLNAANGRLIAHRRTFIQGMLNVLRGQPVQQPVYAADGRPAAGRGGRRLGTV